MLKRAIVFLIASAALATLLVGPRKLHSAGTEEPEKGAVQAVLEQFWRAFAWDAKGMEEALHMPSILIETDPKQTGGTVFLIDQQEMAKLKGEMPPEEVAKQRQEEDLFKLDKCEVELVGKSAAVARYTLIMKGGTFAGANQRLATLLHKSEKGWKIVASTIPQ